MNINPAKLGLCINNAILLVKDNANYNPLTVEKEEFKQLVLDLYLLSTECEDKIKAYETPKEKESSISKELNKEDLLSLDDLKVREIQGKHTFGEEHFTFN